MRYWLFKSEPESFSIDDLYAMPKKTEHWDGVRNYQVRNMLRDEIKTGDMAFFYHSNAKPSGIVGIMEVVKDGYPDPNAWNLESDYYDSKSSPENPRWFMVDVRFVKKFKKMISLPEIREVKALKDMLIVQTGSRLSITPVSKKEWDVILKMENQ